MIESTPRQHPLRGARVARGMSLRELARRADMDPTQLSKIERGLSHPSATMLKRIADALGLTDLSWMLAPYARTDGRRRSDRKAS